MLRAAVEDVYSKGPGFEANHLPKRLRHLYTTPELGYTHKFLRSLMLSLCSPSPSVQTPNCHGFGVPSTLRVAVAIGGDVNRTSPLRLPRLPPDFPPICHEELVSERSRKRPLGQGIDACFCLYLLLPHSDCSAYRDFSKFCGAFGGRASIATRRAERAEGHHILVQLGDFGQQLVE